MRTKILLLGLTLLLFLTPEAALAQVDARLLRQPDVSETQVAFVYAGDIWVAPKTGGTAHRLSSPKGTEAFPRFSPDGSEIAFSGNYDGNEDLYVMPAAGGQPRRVTHHPDDDRMLGWLPERGEILFASRMKSGRRRFRQLYRVDKDGGLPQQLPVPYGEFGAVSPDGRTLAYTPATRAFRTWKRYRGGTAPDIWLFDLETYEAQNVTDHPANDEIPMWDGHTMYFVSDRGANKRFNIWAYERGSQALRQVTRFEDFDVQFPAIGPSDLVFQAGPNLYRMPLDSEEPQKLDISVVTDRSTRKPRAENVSDQIQSAWISPAGKRVVFEARGELFSVPAEHGVTRNLTRTSGTAERHPAWSPDGKHVAYFSDASGEYQLTVQPADGSGEPRRLTSLGEGYRYQPYWSPGSEKLAFINQAMEISIYDMGDDDVTTVDQGRWRYQGELAAFSVSWSPDGRYIAYTKGMKNRNGAIFIYDTQEGQLHQATSAYYSERDPAFGPDGKYLFTFTSRTFDPSYSDVDDSFIYANTTNVAAIPLREDVPSPLAPRNDEAEAAGAETDSTQQQQEEASDGEEQEEEKEAAPVEIDFEHFERRLTVLPPPAGNYGNLQAAEGKILYHRMPRTGAAGDEGEQKQPVVYYDLEAREEKTVLKDADTYMLSANGKKVLFSQKGKYAIADVKPKQKMEKPLSTSGLEMQVDPVAEWQQIFADAWRFERDFFYDPNMHGVDWQAMREKYGALIDDASTRSDVNYLIGELIAELNSSHTYRGGGDTEQPERRSVGLLGANWTVHDGAYQIEEILRGAPWDADTQSPLARSGIDVEAGDYVLAVNGVPLDTSEDPWAAFQGMAGATVALTINDEPTMEGAREVIVETTGSEARLRLLDWIEKKRKRVAEATDGRVGYIYVPNTSIGGQTQLVRQFRAQFNRPGLIIDERFNSGGQIPDRFIELLNRPELAYWAVRDGRDWQWPPVAHFGPKAMLINGWSGSGGDAFPDYFKKADLGPLVGTRTWGGLIGYTGAPPLIDGGSVTVPTFRMYDPQGDWFAEGRGVQPDLSVVNDPEAMTNGRDPQLEAAIDAVLRRLEENPPRTPPRPAYEDRSRR